jgi:DNA gyrase subunit B
MSKGSSTTSNTSTNAKKTEVVHPDIISFEAEDTERKIALEVAMQWTTAYSESVHTYANTINTHEGGTHEEGFRAALTTLVNKFARSSGYSKKKTRTSPVTTCVRDSPPWCRSSLGEPQFEGQTKTKLGNTEAKSFVQKVTGEHLGDWFERNPAKVKMWCEKPFKPRQLELPREKLASKPTQGTAGVRGNARQSSRTVSPKMRHSVKFSSWRVTPLAAARCQGATRKPRRFLPLRGKILNVEKARLDRALGNNEIQGMITAFGAGIGEDFRR